MQANRCVKDRLCDFEDVLCEIDPGYKDAKYAYFLTLRKDTCEEDLLEIIKKSESLELGNIVNIREPRESHNELETTYYLEIDVKE